MWLEHFRCPGTTKLFSGEGQEILVDEVSRGEACSKSEQERLFHHHDASPASVRSFRFHTATFSGSAEPYLDPSTYQNAQNGNTAA
jgi:hypothetical protein